MNVNKKFDNIAMQIYQSIRKPMPKPSHTLKSKKDKAKQRDIKKGRKNWRFDESISKNTK